MPTMIRAVVMKIEALILTILITPIVIERILLIARIKTTKVLVMTMMTKIFDGSKKNSNSTNNSNNKKQ